MNRQWEIGKKNTLTFYANKLRYKEKQFNFVFPLHDYFAPMIGSKTEVSIADLGAGMFSTTGSTWPTAVVHLYPSDILADEYNQMLKDKKVKPVFPVDVQDMEKLLYPNEFFDIVHCVNALDHCQDPRAALKEMYRVCKHGGWIYLRHFLNNGEQHHYKAFHKWNISRSNGDSFMWNEGAKDCFYFGEYFTGFLTHIVNNTDTSIEVVSMLRKGIEL